MMLRMMLRMMMMRLSAFLRSPDNANNANSNACPMRGSASLLMSALDSCIHAEQRPRLRRTVVQIRTQIVPDHVAVAKRVLVESRAARAAPAPPQLHAFRCGGVYGHAVHRPPRIHVAVGPAETA